jgi:hypothetical protein
VSLSENKIVVYRFRMMDAGREIAPQHMWGTAEAIAALPGCEPIPESARTVHRKLLEQGFFFEQAAGSYIPIDEQGPPGRE